MAPTWTALESVGMFDLGEGVALDPEGNVLVAGISQNASGKDAVTMKLSADGARLWSRVFDEGPDDRAEDVAADAEGNVYVAATVGTRAGDDVRVLKYDREGQLAWAARLDKGTSEAAHAIALDPWGNVLVGGVSLSLNGADGFLAKLAPDGKELWSKPINLHYLDEVFDVDVDGAGNAVVAGRVLRDSSFDVLVGKLNGTGDVLWTRVLATPGHQEARGVAVDAKGAIYVSGTSVSEETGNASRDVMVARLSATGDPEWRRTLDFSGSDDEGRDAEVDATGNVLVTGFGRFDGTKQPVVVKLDPAGHQVWRHVGEGEGIGGTGALDASRDGAVIVAAGARQRNGTEFDFLVSRFDQGVPTADMRVGDQAPKVDVPIPFFDASVPDLAELVAWTWDFGDGVFSSDRNPIHVYAYGGEYVVRLTVRDAYRNEASMETRLLVEGPLRPLPGAADPELAPDEVARQGGPDAAPTGGGAQGIPGPALPGLMAAVVVAALVAARRRP